MPYGPTPLGMHAPAQAGADGGEANGGAQLPPPLLGSPHTPYTPICATLPAQKVCPPTPRCTSMLQNWVPYALPPLNVHAHTRAEGGAADGSTLLPPDSPHTPTGASIPAQNVCPPPPQCASMLQSWVPHMPGAMGHFQLQHPTSQQVGNSMQLTQF